MNQFLIASLCVLLAPIKLFANPAPSAGCGKAPTSNGSQTQTIQINGTTRSYQLVIPANYNPAVATPLVFGFHHSGGSTIDAERYGIITAKNAETAIYVLPQGLVRQGRTGWNEQCGGDDMLFVKELIKSVEANYCIDSNRHFAYGFSWGADMSNTIGCCMGSQFRAIAPESGGNIGTDMRACQKPTPAFMLQSGAEDRAYGQAAFANVVKSYQKIQECNQDRKTEGQNCISFNGCKNPVIWCSFPGLEHALEPDSGTRIWTFFSQYQ